MNICFLMYPWESIDPETDSTIRLIHECILRGHTVAIATKKNLTMRNSIASVFGRVFIKQSKISQNLKTFHKIATFKKELLPLVGFDSIIMRSEPPLDLISLNFLDSVSNEVFIMNDINGIRIANNKLYTASFFDPDNKFIPATHVSKTPEYLEEVLKTSSTDKMILKPLDGFGGQGVIIVEKKAMQNFRSLLDFYIHKDGEAKNYVILQDYVEGSEKGDVRILMLNGEPIGAMKRIPKADDIRSNLHAGGTVEKHVLTKQEKALCKHIAPKLLQDGLLFVGIDIINGKLIEVNVQSPGGIMRINSLNKVKLQKKVIDFVEDVIKQKEVLISRKSEYRRVIENANS